MGVQPSRIMTGIYHTNEARKKYPRKNIHRGPFDIRARCPDYAIQINISSGVLEHENSLLFCSMHSW